jgi:hypothetical protein
VLFGENRLGNEIVIPGGAFPELGYRVEEKNKERKVLQEGVFLGLFTTFAPPASFIFPSMRLQSRILICNRSGEGETEWHG